jgi:hypothetical protein
MTDKEPEVVITKSAEPITITLTLNAKGDTQIELSCHVTDLSLVDAVRAKYDELIKLYPREKK